MTRLSPGAGPAWTASASGRTGGEQTGANPTDRGKLGSKYHLVVDRSGIPPIIGLRGRPGRPRKRPVSLHADKAYDSSALRQARRGRGITPRRARRGIESSERLGRHRWVVERTLAWLLGYRRLGARYERRADLRRGFWHRACALICVRFLKPATACEACHRAARNLEPGWHTGRTPEDVRDTPT